MKQWIWVILLFLPFGAWAQAPDNQQIEAEINSASSSYYYPRLMDRYRLGDSAITTLEYRYLYYGYLFQPEYDPYASPPEMDSIVLILLREPHLELTDYHSLIRYGTKLMETDPFNPRLLNILTYAYGTINDTENETRSAARFRGIIDAILSSGEGNEESSPWHIMAFSHAEDVLDFLGQKYKKAVLVSRTTEYFPLEKRDGRIKGYYFDFSRIYTKRPTQPQQERRWQINSKVLD